MAHDEPWQVFSENGEAVLGKSATRDQFDDDLIMGAAHVWLWQRVGSSGEIKVLLQRRSVTKKTWPGFYDISAAGHIDVGETPVQSAVREAKEEIGLDIDPSRLLYIFSLRTPLAPNEIDHVFLWEITTDFEARFDDGEVETVEWLTIEELRERTADPSAYNLVNQGKSYFSLLFDNLDKL